MADSGGLRNCSSGERNATSDRPMASVRPHGAVTGMREELGSPARPAQASHNKLHIARAGPVNGKCK
eukprot:15457668-Alexandrium_andersonii.AAC.1